MEIYKSLDNKGTLNKDAKVSILYSQYGMLLYTMGRYYKLNSNSGELRCHEDCSIYNECVGSSYVLCLKVYDLMNKKIEDSRLYFTEVRMTLFLSMIFLKLLR